MDRPVASLEGSWGDILISVLSIILDYGPGSKAGICGNILCEMERAEGYTSELENEIHKLFLKVASNWDKFSGVYNYPVPLPSSPVTCYSLLPCWEGEYGKNRMELVKFVRDYLLQQRELQRHTISQGL